MPFDILFERLCGTLVVLGQEHDTRAYVAKRAADELRTKADRLVDRLQA